MFCVFLFGVYFETSLVKPLNFIGCALIFNPPASASKSAGIGAICHLFQPFRMVSQFMHLIPSMILVATGLQAYYPMLVLLLGLRFQCLLSPKENSLLPFGAILSHQSHKTDPKSECPDLTRNSSDPEAAPR